MANLLIPGVDESCLVRAAAPRGSALLLARISLGLVSRALARPGPAGPESGCGVRGAFLLAFYLTSTTTITV